jgi:hypothetical protein
VSDEKANKRSEKLQIVMGAIVSALAAIAVIATVYSRMKKGRQVDGAVWEHLCDTVRGLYKGRKMSSIE